MKRFRNLFLVMVVAALALSAVGVAVAQDAVTVQLGPITQRVIERGRLVCGVNSTLPGFGFPNDAGEYEGFDVDVCRAVAAAILGDASAVDYRPITAAERPTVLQSGEVDMISRNTTWTLSRDTEWGAIFAPTTFYDAQGIMVYAETGIGDLAGLEGGIICTNAGTTTELNITDAMGSAGLEFELLTFENFDAVMATFRDGGCDAVTSDISGLASRRAAEPDPGALSILDLELSKEPLGPLSPQSDPQFADIIRWTIYGLIQAEEFGITSANVSEFMTSEDPAVQRFLGVGENRAGVLLGISNDFIVTVITQVGNYGEVFERNIGVDTPFGLARGLNDLWTNGGLQYSPPFR
ncbi:MAG: amino acid ABC transporter substrate-binding protein [Chloroflexota bacterium]|nr:amino acid ABC transporter substrate-binding protein [Chloroflexota bacterium]